MAAGRPTKLTENMILKLEKKFRAGATTLEAIEGIIAESSYYKYLNLNEEFAERMELAREYVTEIARGVVAKRIKRGDADSAKWWLERKDKKNFSPRSELTGPNGKDLSPVLVQFVGGEDEPSSRTDTD